MSGHAKTVLLQGVERERLVPDLEVFWCRYK